MRVMTDRVRAPWSYIWIGVTMHTSRTIRLIAATVAMFLIEALPLSISCAEITSTGVVVSHPATNDAVDGSMVQISLDFGVPVDHERSTLTLNSSQGHRQVRPRLESAPNYLFGIAG
jgi:methionine-rich copper-binding protein CopC